LWNCETHAVFSREGWQWKSSVEQSGTEIAAHSPTEFTLNYFDSRNDLNEGHAQIKKHQKKSLLIKTGMIYGV